MYIPDQFRLDDIGAQHALMRAYPFATLITHGDDGLEISHLPTILKSDSALGVVECHLARANPHWRSISRSGRGLMIYNGPQAYITPGWYPGKKVHGKVVPTWNYAVVHAHGTAEAIDDRDWLVRHVAELTDQQETGTAEPWATSDAPGNYIEVMARGIVGMRFTIERIEGKSKMSQNRELPDREGVAVGLAKRAGEGDATVAAAVGALLNRAD